MASYDAIKDLPLTVGATRIPADDSLVSAIGIEAPDGWFCIVK